jgi:hypothetical protein
MGLTCISTQILVDIEDNFLRIFAFTLFVYYYYQNRNVKDEEVVRDDQANPGASPAADEVRHGQDGRRKIALDLESTLAQLGVIDGVYLVVEDIPSDVRLSAGRCNGNETWSLGPGELDKLHAVVPSARSGSFALRVRVLCPDPCGYEYANTVAQFDIVIDRDAARASGLPKRMPDAKDVAPLAKTVVAAACGETAATEGRALMVIADPSAPGDWRAVAERRLTDDELTVARMHAEWEAVEQQRSAARKSTLLHYHESTLAQLEEQRCQRQAARASMADALKGARLAAQERTRETEPPAAPVHQISSNPRQSAMGWMIAGLAGCVGLGCVALAMWNL